MIQKCVKIKNKSGVHARPASAIVKELKKYDAKINLVQGEEEVNAKSLMGIMSLGITKGSEISIEAEGEEAKEAVNALVELIESGFNE